MVVALILLRNQDDSKLKEINDDSQSCNSHFYRSRTGFGTDESVSSGDFKIEGQHNIAIRFPDCPVESIQEQPLCADVKIFEFQIGSFIQFFQ